jgi:hypothetical protein
MSNKTFAQAFTTDGHIEVGDQNPFKLSLSHEQFG